ncbi:MAG: hypothetical protein HKN23_04615 [Verrucomicrobiales bacterium]|nr:hypothetical protein [Verrucomicrobiales bacterium]
MSEESDPATKGKSLRDRGPGIAAFVILIPVIYLASMGPMQFLATSLSNHGKWKPEYQQAWEIGYWPLNQLSTKSTGFGKVTGWLIDKGHDMAL